MGLISKKGIHKTIYEVKPEETYFVAQYKDNVVLGGGLDNTLWGDLEDGIVKLSYILSNGKTIEIPQYEKYMHLVEASMSIDKSTNEFYGKNYHYVYIKGYTGSEILTHRVHLRSEDKNKVGEVDVIVEGLEELDKYANGWKESL